LAEKEKSPSRSAVVGMMAALLKSWFRREGGLVSAPQVLASSLSLRINSKSEPCSSLVPDLVTTFFSKPDSLAVLRDRLGGFPAAYQVVVCCGSNDTLLLGSEYAEHRVIAK
jgi:hypothetical protein